MEHTMETLLAHSSWDESKQKHEKIRSIHFDHSGHAIATNSHVLLGTKNLFDINKAGRSFKNTDINKESEITFPKWKEILPNECYRKLTVEIPEWFSLFTKEVQDTTMVLDYSNPNEVFFRTSETTNDSSFAFNIKYLANFAGETISILITSPVSPVVIVKEESTIDIYSKHLKEEILKEDWFYILMPIRLKEELSKGFYI